MQPSPVPFAVGALLKGSAGTQEEHPFSTPEISWAEEMGLVGSLEGVIHIQRIDQALFVTLEDFSFTREAPCARCLTPSRLPVSVNQVSRRFLFADGQDDQSLVVPHESALGLDVSREILAAEPQHR